jgi:hypothetical protein
MGLPSSAFIFRVEFFIPEDGGRMFFRNFAVHPQVHTVLQLRRATNS